MVHRHYMSGVKDDTVFIACEMRILGELLEVFAD